MKKITFNKEKLNSLENKGIEEFANEWDTKSKSESKFNGVVLAVCAGVAVGLLLSPLAGTTTFTAIISGVMLKEIATSAYNFDLSKRLEIQYSDNSSAKKEVSVCRRAGLSFAAKFGAVFAAGAIVSASLVAVEIGKKFNKASTPVVTAPVERVVKADMPKAPAISAKFSA